MDTKLAAYLTYGREKTAALPLLSRLTGAVSRGVQSAARGFAPAAPTIDVQPLARNPRAKPAGRARATGADKTTVTAAPPPAASEGGKGMSPWTMAAIGVPAVAGLGYGAYRMFNDSPQQQQKLGAYLNHGKDKSQLSEGTRVEKKEHGKDFDALAKQVAKAHLKEDPRYYTHLKAMEEGKNPFVRDHAK